MVFINPRSRFEEQNHCCGMKILTTLKRLYSNVFERRFGLDKKKRGFGRNIPLIYSRQFSNFPQTATLFLPERKKSKRMERKKNFKGLLESLTQTSTKCFSGTVANLLRKRNTVLATRIPEVISFISN